MRPALRGIKERFQPAIRAILKTRRGAALDEAALPAYAHRNPLVEWVFWRRLDVALREVDRHGGSRALDFGCGTGVMSEALAVAGFHVTATDQTLEPLKLVRERVGFSTSIEFHEGDLASLDLPPGSFDVVVALDVLEHVSPLAPCLEALAGLLRPDGILVISGPTESFLYRLGRALAGPEFTGHYHQHDVRDVAASARTLFDVKTVARLVWPATLFEILTCRRRNG